MKSIKLKLVILYLALVFIVMIVSGTIMIFRVRYYEIEKLHGELKKSADFTKNLVIYKTDDQTQFQKLLNEMYVNAMDELSKEVQVFILTSKGKYFVSSAKDDTVFGTSEDYESLYKLSDVIFPAMNGKANFKEDRKVLGKNGMIKLSEYACPVYKMEDGETTNEIAYILYTRADMAKIYDYSYVMATTIFYTVIVALILTAIIGYYIADTFTAPILKLTKKSKEMAQGNLYQEIKVYSIDEIGQLTSSFNFMAKELGKTIKGIESEKSKLEILLSNMTDGVLAFDTDGKLIHGNSISYEILGVKEDYNLSFVDVNKLLDININDLNDFNETEIKEFSVSLGDKYINAVYSVYSNNYSDLKGVIIVLQDFTKYKKLDNMRKEFVANVSHEIRTPLTTIKGYTETLIDGAIEEKELALSFLSVIESEADRMTLLVKDLLELSRFDNQQLKIEVSNVDLISVIKETIIQNKLSAEKKEQTIIFIDDIKEAIIRADRGRIIQVITNIVGNAVKYSVEKGNIIISIKDSKDFFVINIKDSGIGIPKEDLNRIFERFFRVDKARSRAMGGTGLGLSIAKEIMEAHEGRISATSELAKGTNIKLEFNKKFDILNEEFN